MSELTTTWFRVGSARYLQGCGTSIEDADDLNAFGIHQASEFAHDIIRTIRITDKIRIITSTSGRAIHAAKKICDVFAERSAFSKRDLHNKSSDYDSIIIPDSNLDDLGNLNPIIARWLIQGEQERICGVEIKGYRSVTNPENLNQFDYLRSRYWENIDPNFFKRILPKDAFEMVMGIESLEEVSERIASFMHWLYSKTLTGNSRRNYIIVTHGIVLLHVFEDYIRPGGSKNLVVR